MRIFFIVAAAIIVFSTNRADAKDMLVLAPSSPWAVNYSDQSCSLIREFGTNDASVKLEIREFAPDKDFELLAMGHPLQPNASDKESLSFRFEPDTESAKPRRPLLGKFGGTAGIRMTASLEPAQRYNARATLDSKQRGAEEALPYKPDITREAEVHRLALSGPFANDIALELGSMAKPMAALRTCLDDLMKHWRIDAEAQKTLTRRPYPKNEDRRWITTNDYPRDKLREDRSAIVDTRLMIDTNGKISDCVVLSEGSDAEFNRLTCDLAKRRARFHPALDVNGKPISSYFVLSVTWIVWPLH